MFEPDHRGARIRCSPNYGERLGCTAPNMIILHYTGMSSGQEAEGWLCVPESQVSSHYLVHEDGEIVQMVREAHRAWHAGKSFWAGATDINSISVGIEIVNPGHTLGYRDFPEVQIDAVTALCRDIATRYGILPARVLAHSDVAPGRKIDPGEKFPWHRLFEAGLGLCAPGGPAMTDADGGLPAGPELVRQVQQSLASYGYAVEETGEPDEQTVVVVQAFQRHFQPWRVDGKIDASVLQTLRALLQDSAVTQPEA